MSGRGESARTEDSRRSRTTAGCANTISNEQRRIDELRLLHRWSTVTYKSLSSEFTKDWDVWRTAVPKVALKYDFLLNTILALSSFELAFSSCTEAAQHYRKIALEYQSLAYATFRGHLRFLLDRSSEDPGHQDVEESVRTKRLLECLAEYFSLDELERKSVKDNVRTLGIELDADEHDALLYVSILMTVLALASATAKSPPLPALTSSGGRISLIEHTIAHHKLVQGIGMMLMSKADCIITHDLFRQLPRLHKLEETQIEPSFEGVLEKLDKLNASRDRCQLQDDSATPFAACRNGIRWLRYLSRTGLNQKIRTICLPWLSMAGDGYVRAIKNNDQISWLLLTIWAVLMQSVGEEYWYGKDFGKSLFEEIANEIESGAAEQAAEVLKWAREEISQISKTGTRRPMGLVNCGELVSIEPASDV